ncbi:hypothetical protein H8356DRAFT_1422789 [Neocallimastix lanati (nom. inval.)]|nr:hypothetical protein H8356DRAFT_1422789 [Neocallimastix sp. JGI-2020a]
MYLKTDASSTIVYVFNNNQDSEDYINIILLHRFGVDENLYLSETNMKDLLLRDILNHHQERNNCTNPLTDSMLSALAITDSMLSTGIIVMAIEHQLVTKSIQKPYCVLAFMLHCKLNNTVVIKLSYEPRLILSYYFLLDNVESLSNSNRNYFTISIRCLLFVLLKRYINDWYSIEVNICEIDSVVFTKYSHEPREILSGDLTSIDLLCEKCFSLSYHFDVDSFGFLLREILMTGELVVLLNVIVSQILNNKLSKTKIPPRKKKEEHLNTTFDSNSMYYNYIYVLKRRSQLNFMLKLKLTYLQLRLNKFLEYININ